MGRRARRDPAAYLRGEHWDGEPWRVTVRWRTPRGAEVREVAVPASAIGAVIRRLHPRQRTAVELRYRERLDCAAVCARLGVSDGTPHRDVNAALDAVLAAVRAGIRAGGLAAAA